MDLNDIIIDLNSERECIDLFETFLSTLGGSLQDDDTPMDLFTERVSKTEHGAIALLWRGFYNGVQAAAQYVDEMAEGGYNGYSDGYMDID